MTLVRAIVADDLAAVRKLVVATPGLATARAEAGATRSEAAPHFLDEISHYVYAGDTALHIAAAAHQPRMVELLLKSGADVAARNRRQAEPLHYAVDGGPASSRWN